MGDSKMGKGGGQEGVRNRVSERIKKRAMGKL